MKPPWSACLHYVGGNILPPQPVPNAVLAHSTEPLGAIENACQRVRRTEGTGEKSPSTNLKSSRRIFRSSYPSTRQFMRLQAAQEHAASVSIARSLDALTLPQVVVKGHINVVLEKAERVSPRVRTEGPRLTWKMWKMFPRCELRRSSEAWWLWSVHTQSPRYPCHHSILFQVQGQWPPCSLVFIH